MTIVIGEAGLLGQIKKFRAGSRLKELKSRLEHEKAIAADPASVWGESEIRSLGGKGSENYRAEAKKARAEARAEVARLEAEIARLGKLSEDAADAEGNALAEAAVRAAEAGLRLTALRLAEGAALDEVSIDHVLSGLRLGGHAVGGIRKLGKERRIRKEKRRAAARREEAARAARAAERQAELEHEMRLAAIRNGTAAPGAPHVG